MKLVITELQAMVLSLIFASFFVIAVYIWKPIFIVPGLNLTNSPKQLDPKEEKRRMKQNPAIAEFEMRMRIASVGFLCLLAFISIVLMGDPLRRRDVSIARWFGLPITPEVIRVSGYCLLLNSILFSGEIFQLVTGMT